MVSSFKAKIKIIALVLIAICCTLSEKGKLMNPSVTKINGLWYTVSPDSSYLEVYFSDSLYSVHYSDGLNLFKYEITQGDSIHVLDEMFKNKFKFQLTDSSIMIITSEKGSFKYFKIDNEFSSDEWINFIKGDIETRDRYMQLFLARKSNALSKIGK